MKIPRTAITAACFLSAIGLGPGFGQEQHERGGEDARCKTIKAREALHFVTENCASPALRCAAGVITGDEFLEGNQFVRILRLAPSIGLAGIEPQTTVSLAAERTVTTPHGSLTFRVAGVFDTARGVFAEINRVTGGTETFEGATGTLWTTGAGMIAFEGRVTGQICRSKP